MLRRRLMVTGGGALAIPPVPPPPTPFVIVASPNAGAWTEFTGPHAYYSGTRTYIGWATGNADPNDIEIIARVDGGTIEGPILLANNLSGGSTTTPDSHIGPAVIVRPDGHIVVAYCPHQGTAITVKISTNANDITGGFGSPIAITSTPGTATYPQLSYMSSNSRLYLRWRWSSGGVSGMAQSYSTDGGATWAAAKDILTTTGTLIYSAFASNGADRMDVWVTDKAADAPGGYGLYHFYVSAANSFFKSDGTTISVGPPTFPLVVSDLTQIVATGDEYPYSGGYTADGRPVMAGQSKNADPVAIFERRWSGSAWVRSEIDTSDPISPSVLSVGGGHHVWDDDLRFITGKVMAGEQVIWEYTSTDDGATWGGIGLTTTGANPNSPVYVVNNGTELASVWFIGDFVSSDDFDNGLEGVA